MIRTTLEVLGLFAAVLVIAATVLNSPRCTPQSPDGLRVGGMLMAGCNNRGIQ